MVENEKHKIMTTAATTTTTSKTTTKTNRISTVPTCRKEESDFSLRTEQPDGSRSRSIVANRRKNNHDPPVAACRPSLIGMLLLSLSSTSFILLSNAFSSQSTTTRPVRTIGSSPNFQKQLLRISPSEAYSMPPFKQGQRRPIAVPRLWMTSTASSRGIDANSDNNDDDNPYVMANQIAPKTKSLPESLRFYTRYLANHFFPRTNVNNSDTKLRRKQSKILAKKLFERRRKQKRELEQNGVDTTTSLESQTESEPSFWKQFNEQRRNVMTLAGYTKRMIVPSFTFLLLGALMTSIVPNYWGQCIQCVATLSGSKTQLLQALIGLGISSTLAALFTGIRGSLFWIGGCRANYNVRVKLHRSLLLQEAAFFDTNETGYLLSRLNADVNKIGQVISYHVNVVLRQSAQFLFGSVYLLRISPRLSMYAFGGIFLVAWLSAVYGNLARVLAEKVQDTFADATAVAETSFTMSETIRAFDGTEIESGKFESAQSKALELEEVQAWAYGTHKFLSDTLQSMLQVGLLVACWVAGKAGKLPAGDLTTFLVYTGFVLESSNEVGDQWAKIQQAVGASSSVFDLIKRLPAIRDPPVDESSMSTTDKNNDELNPHSAIDSDPLSTTETSPTTSNGSVVQSDATQISDTNGFAVTAADSQHATMETVTTPVVAMKNVTVEYEAMERPALSKINVKIHPGDRVALVGRSGSGKSSMLRTMLRFYDPSTGRIELSGVDLKSMTRAETAARISLVEQEPHVFPMSLMENVLYGIDRDAIDEETGEPTYSDRYRAMVANCLSLAGLSVEPGNELGLDLDTRIGEGGRSLSGGQRQRVAVTRAIIRSPQLLLLDEPTAALDSESEKMVVYSLQRAMEHTKSMVMVTHRLGVVRSLDVNRVIVLDRGEIVEEGHPEDLLQDEDSHYFALAREQGISKKPSDDVDATNQRLPAFS